MELSPLKNRIPEILLLGPGPSNPFPSVYEAISLPLVGHLDEVFGRVLEEVQEGLRNLFSTRNPVTFAVSGTGSAGMEFLAMNLIEPGDRVVVGVNGVFGERIAEMAKKLGAEVSPLPYPPGKGVDPEDLKKLLDRLRSPSLVWVVHAETSTGYRQNNIQELAEITHAYGGLFLLDCVTSLGGIPVLVDAWGVDAVFSGTQKCLGVTPSLSPVTLGERALERFRKRRHPVASWYFDLEKLLSYWNAPQGKRVYHHTAPIAPIYALHEGIRILLVEGLDQVYRRYETLARELEIALEERGFQYLVEERTSRLPMLHCLFPPPSVDAETLRRLLREERIEIGGALGELKGKAVRIGVMARNMFSDRIETFLRTLDRVLDRCKPRLPL
jgi:alanine-glyoxylate transaminase/serine-glyoxylate transaminase/serine-pyruvate transaminase